MVEALHFIISGMDDAHSEWLLTDGRGSFAMGTPQGVRFRKYHGFYMGISGRSETAFLSDFEFQWNGILLWPHQEGIRRTYHWTELGPVWKWDLKRGKLSFTVESLVPGGFKYSWRWVTARRPKLKVRRLNGVLRIRPFFSMRNLHDIGGQLWTFERKESQFFRVHSVSGAEIYCSISDSLNWKEDPQWYFSFHYQEETQRGELSRENLFSAGFLESELESEWGEGGEASFTLTEDPLELFSGRPQSRFPVQDFVVKRPAGVVAGYPWLGEWGRDTFVSLPGIFMGWIRAGGDPSEVWAWASEVLEKWGEWIDRTGMIPGVIEKGGSHQWESSDGTLWWCHSLASFWAFSLAAPYYFPGIKTRFSSLLGIAIASIRQGRHLFLREDADGLLEVTESHTTWMDAKVDGAAVTPRLGRLPEINALWFQAICLHSLLNGRKLPQELQELGRRVLHCREPNRPNEIFLHSLPLAPSFVLGEWEIMIKDLSEIAGKLWTPFGLRSLDPSHPAYRAHCVGTQEQRDRAYHQGPVWAWLGGHFEMARARVVAHQKVKYIHWENKMLVSGSLGHMLIRGHIPEMFDAEPPFTARGSPARAWSLSCFEEANARRRWRVDSKILRALSYQSQFQRVS